MNAASQHPAVLAFESLLALRQYAAANPSDLAGKFANHCAANLKHSRSQLFQDLFVVLFLQGKKNGFFVEFGATDGVDLSNTFILERNFQWKGILAEPAKRWHSALKSNRQASIDTRCVWSESGLKLEFKETAFGELSTLASLVDRDFNRAHRVNGTNYLVDTVSLDDLLEFHNSPKEIDYLSIDTEGSELAILTAFDFGKYDPKIITVEHNYCEPDRRLIGELLAANQFIRLFKSFSKFDDWYIKRSILGV